MESTGDIENLGTKVVFRRKICSKVFYAMNNFGTVQFLLFVIDASKYIFKAIIFIHVTCMHKIKVFLKAFVAGLVFVTYFYFQHCLINNIAEDIFLKINVYFYLMVPFCLGYDNVVHRSKYCVKTNNLTYNMLKLVAKCGSFLSFCSIYLVS